MASIKIKFRPSSVRGKEGVLFLQIIHRRVVRQIVTPYRLHAHEWDAFSQQTTRIYLQSISSPEVDKANASILSSF